MNDNWTELLLRQENDRMLSVIRQMYTKQLELEHELWTKDETISDLKMQVKELLNGSN